MSPLKVPLRRVAPDRGRPLPLPAYETAGSAGLDLRADLVEPLEIPPMGRAMIPTGLALAVPEGYEAQIRPRSGLAARHGVTCLNAPGTVDSDFRGEVNVILANVSNRPFMVQRGDRIAQMVFAPVTKAELAEVDSLDETERGDGGFGHTGSH